MYIDNASKVVLIEVSKKWDCPNEMSSAKIRRAKKKYECSVKDRAKETSAKDTAKQTTR